MSKKKIIKTNSYEDVANVCQTMGDNLATTFHAEGSIKAGLAAATLYKTMVAVGKAGILSPKQTGKASGL